MNLRELCTQITPPNEQARLRAKKRWDSIAKPLGSLGLLETAISDIAALTGCDEMETHPRSVIVLCADNGVTVRGVAQTDCTVTAIAARKLAQGSTAVCRMAQTADCSVIPVDMGIRNFTDYPGILNRRIGNGTADFTCTPAMSRAQAEQAVLTGVELVRMEYANGTRLLAAGEMGIGNTTTASAITSVLLNLPPETVTGRGAGLSNAGLQRKISAIRDGISRNLPDASDPLDVLSKMGGYDLAGMCGLYLGGALYGIPVLMDGFPSAAAALCAMRICPAAQKAIFASHVSAEPAGHLILKALGKRPLITAEMRLGEGTGAVCAMPLLDMALAVYRNAYTFEEGGIPAYTPQNT